MNATLNAATGTPETAGSFFNLYNHGMVRTAVCVPECRVADPAFNAQKTIDLLRQAADHQTLLAIFPELGLTAYTCDDLFHQRPLQDQALAALATVRDATKGLMTIAVVGLPLLIHERLFNCAVVLRDGVICGVVPKSYLPNYREYYEPRQFQPAVAGVDLRQDNISLLGGHQVPFGTDVVFDATDDTGARVATFAVEICEDMWVPLPPSTMQAMAGATILCNLSASNITIGKSDFRHALVRGQSARCLAAYLYCAAGTGESTTDLAWDGQAMIYENGHCLAQAPRFRDGSNLLIADIDVDRLELERMRMGTFHDCRTNANERMVADGPQDHRRIPVPVDLPRDAVCLPGRPVERFPYVPAEPQLRDVRCYEAYNIQVAGLAKRMRSTGIDKLVIGISGGLDSTHALLVAAAAFARLGLPRENILAYTMPGYATSDRTKTNANRLMAAIGCSAKEIDIRPSCEQMLRDLDHPVSRGEPVYDVTFENVQAGERTNHLFRLANRHNGMVLGTGDLSELALGWCTYGVGDHMSHYAVNASVPKTLIQYLIRWVAAREQTTPELRQVLHDILDTEISPELIPADEANRAGSQQPAQRTEDVIGPYELQDFNLFHTLRTGFRPSKVAFLSWCAWHDAGTGHWPDVPEDRRRTYDIGTIRKWLRVFVDRFFRTSQFKRTCIPNAPKVGSGGSLSPRGDWRAPSDSSPAPWLADVDTIPGQDPPVSG